MSAHDLDENELPSIKLSADDAVYLSERQHRNQQKRVVKKTNTAPLWALLVAVFIALGGVSWWSFQQITLLSQQLVATQESFAYISEAADGRLQKISGLVSAAETNTSAETKQLKQQFTELQGLAQKQQEKMAALTTTVNQLQHDLKQAVADKTSQQKTVEALQKEQKEHSQSYAKQQEVVKSLTEQTTQQQQALKQQQQLLDKNLAMLDQRLKALDGKLTAGANTKGLQDDVRNLKQDLLILRTELEGKGSSAAGVSQQEFDAFRAQINRRLGTK